MLSTKEVKFSIPGWISVTMEPNEAEQQAAWSMYVELSTRVASQPFKRETGRMRAALDSLYSLFGLTRQLLRDAGPLVAHGSDSLGPLAIRFLTEVLAPFTTKWNEPLAAHETSRPEGYDSLRHEHEWDRYAEMLDELETLQQKVDAYLDALARISGVK